jgi:hypothetical protein
MIVLQEKLIQLIEKKAFLECPKTAIKYTTTYIKQLKEHINGVNNLSQSEIIDKIDYLLGCVYVSLNHPLENLEFLRGRRCIQDWFTTFEELSYINYVTANFPKIGRFNKAGTGHYYGALMMPNCNRATNVVLSEIEARELDKINILRSNQKNGCTINASIIGICDHVRRRNKPYYINEPVFSYYEEALNFMKKTFSEELFMAYQLTDRFFADIASSPSSASLYAITSEVFDILLSSECEGILYSSVKAKDEPLIVIKPTSVDEKIDHQCIYNIKVENHFGYEFYKYTIMTSKN